MLSKIANLEDPMRCNLSTLLSNVNPLKSGDTKPQVPSSKNRIAGLPRRIVMKKLIFVLAVMSMIAGCGGGSDSVQVAQNESLPVVVAVYNS